MVTINTFAVDPICVPLPPMPTPSAKAHNNGVCKAGSPIEAIIGIIAAVNGFALGGGCEIAIACHLRFASDNAFFAQPEVKLGLIPGWGGTQRLPRIIGKGNATELIIGGHMINAQEAFRIGLANKVFEQDKLMEETKNFANTILGNGPDSIAESLRCINESAGHSLIDGLNLEVEAFSKRFGTDETNEGLDAFVEKREANFRN